MKQACKNCRFFELAPYKQEWEPGECHRYAPRPGNFLDFYALELLRHIAFAQYAAAKLQPPEDESDDINKEATEAGQDANWPDVQRDDWCGEWLNRLDEMT